MKKEEILAEFPLDLSRSSCSPYIKKITRIRISECSSFCIIKCVSSSFGTTVCGSFFIDNLQRKLHQFL
jgi:hypothetical protein